MAEPAQDTPVTTMSDFVAKYGGMDALDVPPTEAPEAKAAPVAPTPTPKPAADEPPADPDDDLDAKTLQALGLIPEDDVPPSPADDSEQDGAAKPEIDLPALAKTLGLTESDLSVSDKGVMVKTKVDGQVSEVPLEELRTGYQLRSHFTRQNEEFLRQKAEWDQARQQQQQQLDREAQLTSEILKTDEEALTREYSLDWDTLRQDDPAEYAAKVAEYNQRLARLRGRREQVEQTIHQRYQAQQKEMLEQYQARAKDEGAKLAEALGWKSNEEFQKGADQLRQYMVSRIGLQPEEVGSIVDHRTLVVADKARRYDELMGKIDVARKKVQSVHKQPSGIASKPAGGKQRALKDAQKRLSQDHSVEAAANVFKNLGIV